MTSEENAEGEVQAPQSFLSGVAKVAAGLVVTTPLEPKIVWLHALAVHW